MFNISAHGTRAGVIKAIQEAKPQPADADASQLDSAKVFLISEVNGLAEEFNGARIDASGDAQKASRNLQLNVIGLNLAL